jgi:hypothetical protein
MEEFEIPLESDSAFPAELNSDAHPIKDNRYIADRAEIFLCM